MGIGGMHQLMRQMVCCCGQVHASAETLKLITFDADGTLYADGSHFDQDNAMISHLISLMRNKVWSLGHCSCLHLGGMHGTHPAITNKGKPSSA